ncbi:rhodanese-like domain-containing protein [Apibacter raozihei]|uniref:rhodanese-like domain-containing protein n=1 Tax=Apibacter TaxID=1778601 RepID=UPI000FE2F844|nr:MULTISPECIES: rhodanese-like domain-containing protein [Apibacter]
MNLKEIINHPNVTLLDVREEEELINEGKVPNAILIPMNEIPEKIEEIKKFSTPLVVFCRSGNRSGKVVEYLTSQGFSDIYNGGGFKDVNELLDK